MKRFTEKPITIGEQPITFEFKCECGCDDFCRSEIDKKCCVSFFEGSFYCSNCDKEHVYYSDSFNRVPIPQQLQLF